MRRNEAPTPEVIAFQELRQFAGRLLTASNAPAVYTELEATADFKSPEVRKGKKYKLEITSAMHDFMGRSEPQLVLLLTDEIGIDVEINEGHMLFLGGLDQAAEIAKLNATLPARRKTRLSKALQSLVRAADPTVVQLKVGDVVTRRDQSESDVIDDEYTYVVVHVMTPAEQLLYWKAQGGQAPIQHVIVIGTHGPLESDVRTCSPATGIDMLKIGTLDDYGLTVPEGNWLENILPMGPKFQALLGDKPAV